MLSLFRLPLRLSLAAPLAPLALLAALQLSPAGLPAATAHEMSCDKRVGVDLARCERHERMFAKCGPIKGEAHFDCDREFLLAQPLDCSKFQGNDAQQCQDELAAAKTCEPKAGREFVRCMRVHTPPAPQGESTTH
jgi:hypothetical protein